MEEQKYKGSDTKDRVDEGSKRKRWRVKDQKNVGRRKNVEEQAWRKNRNTKEIIRKTEKTRE